MLPVIEVIPSKRFLRRRTILWGIAFLASVGILSYSIHLFRHQTQPLTAPKASSPALGSSSATPSPVQAQAASLLSGKQVLLGTENRRPLAVMIENHPDARPQSGLGEASLVYEAIAEGGITRFMAVFADPTQPVKVGPIRSARVYFVSFANELNPIYAHMGGNTDALQELPSLSNITNVDGIFVGSPVFIRETNRPVATEHTVYSSTDKLWQYATVTLQASQTASFSSWLFQNPAKTDSPAPAQTISINFSSPDFQVDWKYDPSTNQYLRWMAGSPHLDADTGQQIRADNLILQTVTRSSAIDASSQAQEWIYQTIGSGPASIFQNGQTIKGSWKHTLGSRTKFYDASGAEIHFLAGSTWVEIVHPDTPTSS